MKKELDYQRRKDTHDDALLFQCVSHLSPNK